MQYENKAEKINNLYDLRESFSSDLQDELPIVVNKISSYHKRKILQQIPYLKGDVGFYKIGNIIVCDNVWNTYFECDLSLCGGLCCVTGNSGAPVSNKELLVIQREFKRVSRYMDERAVEVASKGAFVKDGKGFATPMLENHGCAYSVKRDGCNLCAFHMAFEQQKSTFYKPTSCAIGAIRSASYNGVEVLHFRSWSICEPAHIVGKKSNTKLFEFLKDSLIMAFGIEFFDELEKLTSTI